MTKISIWVQSEQGRYRPGTAIVRIDGEVHAKLRGEEGFEITVSDPQISTSLKLPPVELSGAAAERAEEILDRRDAACHEAGCETHTQRCSQPQVDCVFDGGSMPPKDDPSFYDTSATGRPR